MMMRQTLCIWCLLGALVLASGCQTSQSSDGMKAPTRAENVRPVSVGQAIPKVVLRMPDNAWFDLNSASAEKPTVLIFYRGGWCPYCSTHLGQLQSIESDLIKLGFQIIAVSPDRPEILKKYAEEQALKYRLLSDSAMTAAVSFGVAFQVDDATVRKYKTSYGIDLEGNSGQKHHLLPVPSVFIIGQDGIIRFSYVNPNYKVRLDPGALLEAAEAVKSKARRSKP